MKTKPQKKVALVPQRRFSESIKVKAVQDIEKGLATVSQLSQELSVSQNSVYRWIYRYSRYLTKNKVMVVEDKSESYRSKELERRLKEAEAALGRKQMEVDFLNKLIELANDKFKTDLKKNLADKPYAGSKSTKGKDTNTK